MSQACEALGLPVVSGNVSLYNETDGRPIHPTPIVGCVGLVPDVREIPGRWQEGDAVFLAGAPELRFDGSELQALYGQTGGRPAPLDLQAEAELVRFLWGHAPRLTLAHDAAEGGLATALVEAALWSDAGVELELPDDPLTLFGEGGGQAIVACAPEHADQLAGVPLRRVGTVAGTTVLGVPVSQLRDRLGGRADVRPLRHPLAGTRRRAHRAISACSRCSTAGRSRRASLSPTKAA